MNMQRLHHGLVIKQIRQCIKNSLGDVVYVDNFPHNYRRLNWNLYATVYNNRGNAIASLPRTYRYSQVITNETLRRSVTEHCIVNIGFLDVLSIIVAEYCI